MQSLKSTVAPGENISFWRDLWVGESPLKDSFPNIYCLASDSQSSVANCYDFNRRCWTPRLRRDLNDWEVGDFIRLLELLGNLNHRLEYQDGWSWKLNQKCLFWSKSFYLELSNCPLLSIPHKGIWNPNIPSKVSFFI